MVQAHATANAGTPRDEVSQRYERFARLEAPRRSALYTAWAAGVAEDAAACDVIARLPPDRRQPPLVFALARMGGAPEAGYAEFAAWLVGHGDELVAQASVRSLQTNEPRRSAVLLAAMAGIDGPIALIELGASAGLCLVPDRYSYRYTGAADVAIDPAGGVAPVVLDCELRGDRIPGLRLPEIVWRAGLDLRPLDAADPADRRFVTALVWPGEEGRAERIGAALDIAAAERLRIDSGDATDAAAIGRLVDAAPSGASVVITTPGLLPHIPRAGRERLFDALAALRARPGTAVHTISLDPPTLHDRWPGGVDPSGWPGFVLTRDGRPVAAADPLGAWLEWRADSPARRA